MRVLIIKLTSMGDLMHAFPALTDAVNNIPGITFDWVVDESFAEVPKWHPAVGRVMTTAHRRWKKDLVGAWKNKELSHFHQTLNENDYDVVVDLQSNLKSAFVSWLRRGPVQGYDKHTCREKPAHWAYANHYSVDLHQHAIERQRQLFAKIFAYTLPTVPSDYGVVLDRCDLPAITLPEKYVVFVHNASWPTKLWPVESWQALLKKVEARGYSVLLPCGSNAEYERATVIAASGTLSTALPKMGLDEMAAIMLKAQAAVCSDTGLAHMAAVTSTPAITLYAVTDTVLIGTIGKNQQHIVASELPSLDQNKSPCMGDISIDQVWGKLSLLLE